MAALVKSKTLKLSLASCVRGILFDGSKNPDKINQMKPPPNTIIQCDGSAHSCGAKKRAQMQRGGRGGGTGVMVTTRNSAFRDYTRTFYPLVQQEYKTTNCSAIMEYLALRDGFNFALELLGEGKIQSPIVVETDLESLPTNIEKLYFSKPHGIGNHLMDICTEICNLVDFMPPYTSLIYNKGSKVSAPHFLAKSILIRDEEEQLEKTLLEEFYDLYFSFEPGKISQGLRWAINLCEFYRISPGCPVLEIGCGNGMLLQQLNKLRFSEDLVGIDSSKGIIGYACDLAKQNGHHNISFLVDDVRYTTLNRRFPLVLDNGTLDAIRLHPSDRLMYWESVARLVEPRGLLVVISHFSAFGVLGMTEKFALVQASRDENATIMAFLRI